MDIAMEPDIRNNREFSRIEAHLPLEIRLVPPEQRQRLRCRIEELKIPALEQLPPDVEDPNLAAWLKLIHAKLDILLSLLMNNQQRHDLSLINTENISGGGVSFISAEEFHLDDMLEIKMMFSSLLPRALHLYGEVVQTKKIAEGYFTAVRFLCLDEGLRDEIVKFVFEKERELLRSRREVMQE